MKGLTTIEYVGTNTSAWKVAKGWRRTRVFAAGITADIEDKLAEHLDSCEWRLGFAGRPQGAVEVVVVLAHKHGKLRQGAVAHIRSKPLVLGVHCRLWQREAAGDKGHPWDGVVAAQLVVDIAASVEHCSFSPEPQQVSLPPCRVFLHSCCLS